ncbi:MAG: CDP-diacylglycerol--glycerol-3-phosphate 3-phosphatidyltransferase [candidate division KSB1 bacterium]|nr:CDP-diacylglycerol--glycerol-3-phosphate 3-phosphatidyltransferase [candidate division KSB1 bacterium]
MTRPNQLSTLRILLTPLFVSTFLSERVGLQCASFGVFFVASMTDWYDGYVARKSGSVSPWGKFLDPLADKILILSALLALYLRGYVRLWMVAAIAVRDVAITILRSYALLTERPVQTLPIAKWKTVSQVVAIYLALALHTLSLVGMQTSLARAVVGWSQEVDLVGKTMAFVAVYTVVTGVIYLIENRGHVRSLAVRFFRAFAPLN